MQASSKLQLPLIDLVPPSPQPGTDFEFMATNGFLIRSGLIEEALIDEVRDWTRTRFRQADVQDQSRIQDAFQETECVSRLATHPRVLSLLVELYGRRPIPFQTLNFPRGTEQATHSDAFHFNSWPQRWMCGVWVALEDVTETNGPLHYYPGSHRLPVLDANDTSATQQRMDNYKMAIQELIAITGLKKERFLPRKGDCLVWAANLLHGGDPILDPQSSRLSQVSHYYFEGCDFFTPRESDIAVADIFFRDEILDLSTGRPVHTRHQQLRSSQRAGKPLGRRERIRRFLGGVARRCTPG